MRPTALVLAVLASAVLTAASFGARSGAKAGGASIAEAAPLPLGTEVASGALRNRKLNALPWAAEYWKVAMGSGDRLVLDYGATNDLGVGVCMLAPDVSDFTEQKAPCLASAITMDKTELRFTAPVNGFYTVRFAVNACACTDPLSYTFLARVAVLTRILLHVPKLVHHGALVHVNGVITGRATGAVALRISGSLSSRKIAAIRPGGKFSSAFRLRLPGRYTVTAIYYGNPSHAQSTSSARVTAK
jgi:hypothetical protein